MDYVMFGAFGVPMFREHTCFEDGDYCDFKLKLDANPMEYWPLYLNRERAIYKIASWLDEGKEKDRIPRSCLFSKIDLSVLYGLKMSVFRIII